MRSSWKGERKDGTKNANDADELSLRACPVLGKAFLFVCLTSHPQQLLLLLLFTQQEAERRLPNARGSVISTRSVVMSTSPMVSQCFQP